MFSKVTLCDAPLGRHRIMNLGDRSHWSWYHCYLTKSCFVYQGKMDDFHKNNLHKTRPSQKIHSWEDLHPAVLHVFCFEALNVGTTLWKPLSPPTASTPRQRWKMEFQVVWIAIVACHHWKGWVFAEAFWSNLNGSDCRGIMALARFRFIYLYLYNDKYISFSF